MMNAADDDPATDESPGTALPGLFRTAIIANGASLDEAIRHLRSGATDSKIRRGVPLDLFGAMVPVPGEPENHWRILALGLSIVAVVTDCDYRHARGEIVPGEGYIEFHFTIGGEADLSTSAADDVSVRQDNMLIARQEPGETYTIHCPPGPRRLISLYMRPEILAEWFGICPAEMPAAGRSLFDDAPGGLRVYQSPILPETRRALNSLHEAALDNCFNLPLLFPRVWELARLCGRDLSRLAHPDDQIVSFSTRDLKLFDQARRTLETQFNPHPTITSLSRLVGTNTNKLKMGFKAIYGITIFEFGHRHRMEHALARLQKPGNAVGLVAVEIGYSSLASFSTAFKNYHGILPSVISRQSGD